MSCGVETITAPASGTRCAMVSCASPVPGGRSTIEIVELAPFDVGQHLLDGALHHRPAPDHRRILVHEKSHGHHLDAEILHGRQLLAVGAAGLAGDAEHARLGRAVDIGVEHADPLAARRQRQGEIGGRRGFAHPALARSDRDHMADAGKLGLAAEAGGPAAGPRPAPVLTAGCAIARSLRDLAGRSRPARRPLARSAVRTAVTEVTPGRAITASSQAWRRGSLALASASFGSISSAKPTLPSLTTIPETMPRSTTLAAMRGVDEFFSRLRGRCLLLSQAWLKTSIDCTI